ncbi:hypothetical protein [Paenibacillus sp. FSL H3-0286]|uniref:hypothetical protein n=1 Tax=Paenibacillus sp. FSL H3-0286 TaxID=2921427 RepID=UPI003248D78C
MAYYSGNLIPKMTSNTTPSGVASATTYEANPAWKAFDQDDSTYWQSGYYGQASAIRYNFISPQKIRKYTMTCYGNKAPKSWKFEGLSADGVAWIMLDSQTGQIGWNAVPFREFFINNDNYYTAYRINVIENNGDTYYTYIYGIEMMGIVYDQKFLISSGDENDAISVLNKASSGETLIPKMSANIGNGITLSGDSDNLTYPLWQAFDRNPTNTSWLSNNKESAAIIMRIDGNDKIPYSITVQCGSSNLAPVTWNFYGSNDGATWSLLGSKSGDTGWTNFEVREFLLPSVDEANSYYKFEIIKSQNDDRKACQEFNIIYASDSSKVKYMKETERNFISHGMEKSNTIDLSKMFKKKVYIEQNSKSIGSGKVYKKLIDTSKISIKKVSIT